MARRNNTEGRARNRDPSEPDVPSWWASEVLNVRPLGDAAPVLLAMAAAVKKAEPHCFLPLGEIAKRAAKGRTNVATKHIPLLLELGLIVKGRERRTYKTKEGHKRRRLRNCYTLRTDIRPRKFAPPRLSQ